MKDTLPRKTQLETCTRHTLAFYQEGMIHHNTLWMLATVLIFPTGETVILRNKYCSVKNKMVKRTESVQVEMPSELGSSIIITA